MSRDSGKRRLLYYNDSRHTYMYSYDPPMTLEEARAPVDEVAGTAVGTFIYGSGAGPAAMHDSKAGEVWGRRFEKFDSAWAWRAYENVKSLIDAGYDPLNILIERAHEKGMDFFASLRLNHPMDPADEDNPFNWQFRMDHPEWCLTGEGKHSFNWVHPEVRAERFAYIEEYLTKYDIEGLELEFTFCPYYFEADEAERNAPIMTDYLLEVRRLADETAAERGRPFEIGARVLPTQAGNLAQGLDVAAWIQEGLLDFVAPTIYQDHQVDANLPFEWLVDLADGTECHVYPTLQRAVRGLDIADDRMEPNSLELHATIEQLRAGAASFWDRGADGIYMLFLKWPHGPEQRTIFTEAHDPDLLRSKPKSYVVRRHADLSAQFGYESQLKATLEEGEGPQTVRLYLADDPQHAAATLRLRLIWTTTIDAMTLHVNGKPLSLDSARRTQLDAYLAAWLELGVPRDTLIHGWNEISLSLDARPSGLGAPVVWEGCEIVIEHPNPQASFGMP